MGAPVQYVVSLPVSPDTVVVALVAERSEDLEHLGARLLQAGIQHVVIREPEEPYRGAATAVGIEPTDRDRVRPLVTEFKVLR